MSEMKDSELLLNFSAKIKEIRKEISKVIVGQDLSLIHI